MNLDHYWVPRARDYLRELDSHPEWRGRQERWHCPFCEDQSLAITRSDRISCDNSCVRSVSVIGFEAHRHDCSMEEAARILGCLRYEKL